ncbi:hypothetical protein, partial [Deinococcus aquaticus]|uniref:hypothetical protein n=1 Tax=Deinococcus aquaticus TaxID=328692 RepID=UPI003F465D27
MKPGTVSAARPRPALLAVLLTACLTACHRPGPTPAADTITADTVTLTRLPTLTLSARAGTLTLSAA